MSASPESGSKEDSVSKWIPTTNFLELRRLGKLGEELGELQAALSRCIIQGINEIDPSSGKDNRLRLEEEIADVLAQCSCTIVALNLRKAFIESRVQHKKKLMADWESMFSTPEEIEKGEPCKSIFHFMSCFKFKHCPDCGERLSDRSEGE